MVILRLGDEVRDDVKHEAQFPGVGGTLEQDQIALSKWVAQINPQVSAQQLLANWKPL